MKVGLVGAGLMGAGLARLFSKADWQVSVFDPDRAVLTLQKTVVFRRGQPVPMDETKVSASMKQPEVRVLLACNLGKASAVCWTCDLSREYITINADYHT